MGKLIYISLVLFFSLVIQIYTGNIGLIIPVMVLSVFYLTITFGWQLGILSGLLGGVTLDLLYGRSLFISPFINIIASFFAILWLHKGELKFLALQMIPASILSFLYIVPFIYLTYQQTEHGFLLAIENIGAIIASVLITTLLFPCLIKFLDMINGPLGFNFYKTTQDE
ncbi:MAG: hypothetical protein WCR55_02525 [Lentisphaerota bacterium]